MLLAYARASKADDSQVLDLQRDALLLNEVDDTEPIPTLSEGPRSSVLDKIAGPHVLVSPAWAQAVALGRWPSQVRPSPPPALGGIHADEWDRYGQALAAADACHGRWTHGSRLDAARGAALPRAPLAAASGGVSK